MARGRARSGDPQEAGGAAFWSSLGALLQDRSAGRIETVTPDRLTRSTRAAIATGDLTTKDVTRALDAAFLGQVVLGHTTAAYVEAARARSALNGGTPVPRRARPDARMGRIRALALDPHERAALTQLASVSDAAWDLDRLTETNGMLGWALSGRAARLRHIWAHDERHGEAWERAVHGPATPTESGAVGTIEPPAGWTTLPLGNAVTLRHRLARWRSLRPDTLRPDAYEYLGWPAQHAEAVFACAAALPGATLTASPLRTQIGVTSLVCTATIEVDGDVLHFTCSTLTTEHQEELRAAAAQRGLVCHVLPDAEGAPRLGWYVLAGRPAVVPTPIAPARLCRTPRCRHLSATWAPTALGTAMVLSCPTCEAERLGIVAMERLEPGRDGLPPQIREHLAAHPDAPLQAARGRAIIAALGGATPLEAEAGAGPVDIALLGAHAWDSATVPRPAPRRPGTEATLTRRRPRAGVSVTRAS